MQQLTDAALQKNSRTLSLTCWYGSTHQYAPPIDLTLRLRLAAPGLGEISGLRLVGIVALAAALGGCASVTRGTTEYISITSTPSGVEATVSGLDVPTACITPCAIVA